MAQLNPTVLTEDEIIAVKNTILLPLMMEMCNRSYKELEQGKDYLNTLKIAATRILINSIQDDLVASKQYLFSGKIKMYPDPENKLRCEYRFGGYAGEVALVRDVAKAEIAVKLGEYIKGIQMKLEGG